MAPPPARAPSQAMPPPQAMPPAAGGPSMMGTFGSSMAGSVAGSMLGNAISGSISGGGHAPAPQVAAPAGAAPQVCTRESRQFLECMTNTGEQIDQCRGFYDAFKMCQQQASYQ